jgi:hypothetical protein
MRAVRRAAESRRRPILTCTGAAGTVDPGNAPVQAIEVTPQKKVIWALRSWTPPADLGPATIIQLLSEKDVPERVRFGDIQ